jgi:hypothetical protein
MLQQWLVLFSTACFGNLLGLNISAGMRTAISIYILIPLLLVPQLILGGAMIQFDDLHKSITNKIYVPVIGDIMTTRWAYEAISVEQFKNNRYEKPFFEYEMEISQNNWYASFLIPELKKKLNECIIAGKDPAYRELSENCIEKLNYHITDLSEVSGIKPGKRINSLSYQSFNALTSDEVKYYLDSLKTYFRIKEKEETSQLDSIKALKERQIGKDQFIMLREKNSNERLEEILLNRRTKNQIYEADQKFIQKADPIFMKPGSKYGRAHFFAPYKQLGKLRISTLAFNVFIIWIMIIGLFITLYYNVLKRFIIFLEGLKIPIWRKFGREILQI